MHILSSSIELKGLRFHAGHGVSQLEQRVGCSFRVSLRLDFSIKACALEKDQLEGTLDYAEVFKVVQHEFKHISRLIEHVAWRIAQSLLDKFVCIDTVDIKVEKLNPPISADCESAAINLKIGRNKIQ